MYTAWVGRDGFATLQRRLILEAKARHRHYDALVGTEKFRYQVADRACGGRG